VSLSLSTTGWKNPASCINGLPFEIHHRRHAGAGTARQSGLGFGKAEAQFAQALAAQHHGVERPSSARLPWIVRSAAGRSFRFAGQGKKA
jgi:hypothetical protein